MNLENQENQTPKRVVLKYIFNNIDDLLDKYIDLNELLEKFTYKKERKYDISIEIGDGEYLMTAICYNLH